MTTFHRAFIAAIVKSLMRGKSLIQAILAYWTSPFSDRSSKVTLAEEAPKSLHDFLKEAETALLGPVSGDGLANLSVGLRKQFIKGLESGEQCMLPSYSHLLPQGHEKGQFLALDVGGSTLRVAVVELRGRGVEGCEDSEIVSIQNFKITRELKDLEGMDFFDWMAARIAETITADVERENSPEKPIPVAMAWSFPIE